MVELTTRPATGSGAAEAEILRSVGIEPEVDLRKRYGLMAGLVFIAGALMAIPSATLIEPAPPATAYAVGIASLVAGAACLFAPWERMSWNWFHVVILGEVAIISVINGISERPYVIYYAIPLLFSAYVMRSRRVITKHFLIVAVAICGPIAYGPDSSEMAVGIALAGIPVLAIVTAIVTLLRERVEEREHSYAALAEESIRVTLRIRAPLRRTDDAESQDEELERLERIASALAHARERGERSRFRSGPAPAAVAERG